MSDIDYERALASAKKELEELMKFHESTERRITTLKQVIANLMALHGDDVPPDLIGPGLTEACRNVLRASTVEMTPLQVRSALQSAGFDVGKYTNPLASIHAVLKRLVDGSEAEVLKRSGKTYYKWERRLAPPPTTLPNIEAPPPTQSDPLPNVPRPPNSDSIFKPKR
jgi:hypothetical protein